MHELALVEGVVERVTARVGDRRVARVRLRIGALAAVVPEAMQFCFELCARSTPLEDAILEIEAVPARARCHGCGEEIDLPDGLPLCRCGSVDLAILAGNELLIQEVEVF